MVVGVGVLLYAYEPIIRTRLRTAKEQDFYEEGLRLEVSGSYEVAEGLF